MRALPLLVLTSALLAQEPAATVPLVRAQGTATATAEPDEARLAIGVTTQAATAAEASAANARLATAITAALKSGFAKSADISTVNYSVQPEFKYPREGGRPTISGYSANNTVLVKTGDMASIGKMIDTAIKAGATNVHGVEYGLKDDTAVRAQALRAATKAARANADAMADAAGLKIVRVVRIEEGAMNRIIPVREELQMARAQVAMADVPTPVQPRTLQVNATVLLTVEVSK